MRTRDLQKETGGFTEFVPLPFVHMATPIFLQRKARRGPTFREVLLMHAVGRIAYRGWIDNIQASWVKIGVAGARQIAAGRRQRPRRHADGREHLPGRRRRATARSSTRRSSAPIVEPLGRPLEQRTTLYGRTHTVGRRLRPPPEAVEADRLAAAAIVGPASCFGGVQNANAS